MTRGERNAAKGRCLECGHDRDSKNLTCTRCISMITARVARYQKKRRELGKCCRCGCGSERARCKECAALNAAAVRKHREKLRG